MFLSRKVSWVRICFGKETRLIRVSCTLLHSCLGTEWISFLKSVSSFQGLKKAGPVECAPDTSGWFRALESWLPGPVRKAQLLPHHQWGNRVTERILTYGGHVLAFGGLRPLLPQPGSWRLPRNGCLWGWQTGAPAQFPLGTKCTLLSFAEAAVWWGEWESGTGSSLLWGPRKGHSPSGVWGSFGGLGTLLHRPLALLLLLGCCEAGGSCGCFFVVLFPSGFLAPAWLLVCQAVQPIIFIVTIVDLVIHLNLIDPHLLLSLWSWLPYL